MILIKGKNIKNHTSWQKNQYPGKKSEREVCLLFWLKIDSIIGAYVVPILVPKFQLKITVKTSAKARGLLSLFFIVF